MNQAREHHYLFAHRMLPQLFFSDPPRFVEALRQDGERFLNFYWDHVAEHLKPESRLPGEGLGYELHSLERDIQIGLVRLPVPQAVPEAYFVAAAYRPAATSQPPLTRFFTLEFGTDFTETPITVLCEWSGTGHLNYGQGPAPDADAFLASLAELTASQS